MDFAEKLSVENEGKYILYALTISLYFIFLIKGIGILEIVYELIF